jgi:uncharacterized protein DUF4241
MCERLFNPAVATSAERAHLFQYFQDEVAVLTRRSIGELAITSGSVIACDPLGDLQEPAFEQRLPSGTFPVIVCEAIVPSGGHRCAYAEVQVRMTTPITWEIARLHSGPQDGVPDHYFVDSGTGCFMDAECRDVLRARFKPGNQGDAYRAQLIQRLYGERASQDIRTLVERPSLEAGVNCIMFETGWGDDWYCTYLGQDGSGTVCRLLTEFAVLDTERGPG